MKITNTTRGDIGLDFETIIPAGETVEVRNVERFKDNPVIIAWVESGALVSEQDETSGEPGDTERDAAIRTAIEGLDHEKDFTKGGKPEVDAINALMPAECEPVTATERDAIWSTISAQK